MPKGGSGRAAVIDTCYQNCFWIRLGLSHLWQGFPGQKYVCMHHPDGLHMHWKCIPSSCLMYSACAVQLCMHSCQMDPVHIAFTLSSVQSINYWGNHIWHMYTMYNFCLLLDFLHPEMQHEGKQGACLGQARQTGNVLSCICFTQKVIL